MSDLEVGLPRTPREKPPLPTLMQNFLPLLWLAPAPFPFWRSVVDFAHNEPLFGMLWFSFATLFLGGAMITGIQLYFSWLEWRNWPGS